MNDKKAIGQLGVGETADLGEMSLNGSAGERLREMGLLPGAPIRLVRRAPLGCPLGFEVVLNVRNLVKSRIILMKADMSGRTAVIPRLSGIGHDILYFTAPGCGGDAVTKYGDGSRENGQLCL